MLDFLIFLNMPPILISSHAKNIRYISQNSEKNVNTPLSSGIIFKRDFHKIIQNRISVTITGIFMNLAIIGISVINEKITNKLVSIVSMFFIIMKIFEKPSILYKGKKGSTWKCYL